MSDMSPDRAETLAIGYAWGAMDFGASGNFDVAQEFATAFRNHVEHGNGSRWSIQRAFQFWQEFGYLPIPGTGSI